ncbi:hypothetical protein GQ53DRAFT_426391 [Thozetella sp. PMI_491]|nr:hypothetical protein GQ53DRAFT_426391 [Thozetella sp. PMI_491]
MIPALAGGEMGPPCYPSEGELLASIMDKAQSVLSPYPLRLLFAWLGPPLRVAITLRQLEQLGASSVVIGTRRQAITAGLSYQWSSPGFGLWFTHASTNAASGPLWTRATGVIIGLGGATSLVPCQAVDPPCTPAKATPPPAPPSLPTEH